MSLTDGYISERQCGEPVCAGRREREDTGLPVNETLVIAEVTYIKDNNGTTCEIRVGPADAYLPEPAAPKKKKKTSGGSEF